MNGAALLRLATDRAAALNAKEQSSAVFVALYSNRDLRESGAAVASKSHVAAMSMATGLSLVFPACLSVINESGEYAWVSQPYPATQIIAAIRAAESQQ